MSAEWNRIDAVFDGALAVPEEERDAYLCRECGDDPALEAEVRRLLEIASLSEDFLSEPPPAPFTTALGGLGGQIASALDGNGSDPPVDTLFAAGGRVGAYRLVSLLGAGGMGAVYLAERADDDFEHQVAIKVVRAGATGPMIARRFVRERQILARLHHPHIARLFDGGMTADGRPYFVMEVVVGTPLVEFCRREGLDLKERLALLVQAGNAVSYAHDQGIIHRDLKPSNILVTDEGFVKLLDFGIAKLSDEDAGETLTRSGVQVLTPAYSAPEQLRGRPATRASDIYQLGIILYEVVADRLPVGDSPKPPSVVAGAPRPNDLDRVCLKALQVAPEDRYASVADLVADIERWLQGRPVRAAPDTGIYRARKFVGRNRVPLIAASAAFGLALTGGLLIGGGDGPSAVTDAPPPTERTIAVLPFETTGESEYADFGRGLQDGLLARLTNVAALTVKSRTSTQRYEGTDLTVPEIARELNVAWIVEGGVYASGDQIRVNATLIDARADERLWSRDYEREVTIESVFDIQSDLAQTIALSLDAEVSQRERQRLTGRPTDDLEAYRLYIEGRTDMERRTRPALLRAIGRFERAVQRDSAYAEAWSGLADARLLLAIFGHARPDTVLGRVLAEAQRALAEDPGLAEAHATLGLLHDTFLRDAPTGHAELTAAIQKNPSYAPAHQWLGSLEGARGLRDEALEHLLVAAELDPFSSVIQLVLGWTYWWVEGPESDALRHIRQAQTLAPAFAAAHVDEGLVLSHAGRHDEALTALERGLALAIEGTFEWHIAVAGLGVVYARRGDLIRAREELDRLRRSEGTEFLQAMVQSALGDVEAAFQALAEVEWTSTFKWDLHVFPSLEILRGDPRYERLLKTTNELWGLRADGSLPDS